MKFQSIIGAFVVTGAVAFSTSAIADGMPRRSVKDAPYVAPFSWTGFYVGANAGYALRDARTSYTGDANTLALVAGRALPGGHNVGDGGFTGGGQVGYNWQVGTIVLGAEADLGALDIGRDVNARLVNPGPIPIRPGNTNWATGNQWDHRASLSTDWVATLRGRLGWAMDRWMVFATGGVAWTDIDLRGSMAQSFPVGGPTYRTWDGGSSSRETGYVVGGGVEYAMTNNWIVKLEALYYNFGKINDAVVANPANMAINGPALLSRSTDVDMTVVRAGINYKF